LNFSVAPMPQISREASGIGAVNVANYWVEVVSSKSKNNDIAWNFVQHMAANPEIASIYLNKTKKPTALRELIDGQLDDMEINPFASQVLTAKSWYRGKDSGAMEQIFSEMIDGISLTAEKQEEAFQQALNVAAGKIQQTY